MKMPNWLAHVLVGLLSVIAALFAVLNVLFSDRTKPSDTFIAFGYVFGLYFVLSMFIHMVSHRTGRAWLWWLLTPAIVIGVGFGASDGGLLDWYTWAILLLMAASVFLGRLIGHIRRATDHADSSLEQHG